MSRLVAPHDPAWKDAFLKEANAIRAALGPVLEAIHHIGSTAIPGILAKPIIDMLGIATSLEELDARAREMEALGYEAMGAFGIEGRRYFRKSDGSGRRTHHVHAFAAGSPHIERHLAFRDLLIAHPEIAAEYSALKASLPDQPGAYMDGKDPFVAAIEAKALEWRRRGDDLLKR